MAHENVVNFGSTPKLAYAYSTKIKDADEVMYKLRMEMYKHDTEDMANAIGVSTACLYAVRGNRTKWPRPKTFFGLVDYLGFDLALIKR